MSDKTEEEEVSFVLVEDKKTGERKIVPIKIKEIKEKLTSGKIGQVVKPISPSQAPHVTPILPPTTSKEKIKEEFKEEAKPTSSGQVVLLKRPETIKPAVKEKEKIEEKLKRVPAYDRLPELMAREGLPYDRKLELKEKVEEKPKLITPIMPKTEIKEKAKEEVKEKPKLITPIMPKTEIKEKVKEEVKEKPKLATSFMPRPAVKLIPPFVPRTEIKEKPKLVTPYIPKIKVKLIPPFVSRSKEKVKEKITEQLPSEKIKEEIKIEEKPKFRFKPVQKIEFKPKPEQKVEEKIEFKPKPRQEVKIEFKPRPKQIVEEKEKEKEKYKTKTTYIERKHKPVIVFYEEKPKPSLIKQIFDEFSNKRYVRYKNDFEPDTKNYSEVDRYTEIKDVNARKLYTINDFIWKNRKEYTPNVDIPLLPVPSLPGATVYNYSPEKEIVIAPTAKLTLRTPPPQPIIKTTSQVITFLQSIMNESEYWG